MKLNKTWLALGLGTGVGLGGLLWVLSAKKQAITPPVNPVASSKKTPDLKKLLSHLFVQHIIYSSSTKPGDQLEVQRILADIEAMEEKIARLPKTQKIITNYKQKYTKESLERLVNETIPTDLEELSKKWLDFGTTAEAKTQLEIEMGKKLSERAILKAALKQKMK